MKPSQREPSRSRRVAKGTGTVAKFRGVALPANATRRRCLRNECLGLGQRKQDALTSTERNLDALTVDPTFQASMMAKVEQAAENDPSIAAVLAAAKKDPAALVSAAKNDPTIVKSLAAFFVQQMANDQTIALELAKIFSATLAPPAVLSLDIDEPQLVTSDSDNNELSSDDESLG